MTTTTKDLWGMKEKPFKIPTNPDDRDPEDRYLCQAIRHKALSMEEIYAMLSSRLRAVSMTPRDWLEIANAW